MLEFVIKRCFNSDLFLVTKYTEFLISNGAAIDQKFVGKMIGDLKNIIDIFFEEK